VPQTANDEVRVLGTGVPEAERVLTPEALRFVASLQREFSERRKDLLRRRDERQEDFRKGVLPGLLPETEDIRRGTWRVADAPPDLEDRRVEITGPVDRKMMINALNSGAQVFMADFEDSLSPTWNNVVEGQANLVDAVRRELRYTSPEGKAYELGDELATLVVRPRGWHMVEKHVVLDGEPVSASLFDFGLYLFHNAAELIARGSGPYFYLPKLESHLEARLWNDVFEVAQRALGIAPGTIRATVLIETILAALEMDEILYELRDHVAGLNAGRWDYIFSVIKKFRHRQDFLLPDRGQVTMAVPFMRAYAELLVKSCHRRGAHAMGGMAAFIPSRRDEDVNERALEKVREDKRREAAAGFDGTWVAHPDLVPVAREAFDAVLAGRPHQKEELREDVAHGAEQLLGVAIPGGAITDDGVRANISIALQYLDSWLQGTGAAAINNLMEDTATAEISRAQLWQWIRHGATLAGGGRVDAAYVRRVFGEELEKLRAASQPGSRLEDAAALLDRLVQGEDFEEFLTKPGYDYL
jgi:malate synthase